MQKFSPEDLYLHRKLTELDALQDTRLGGVAAATVRSVDRERNTYVSHIWQFHGDGSPPRQLTQGTALDKSPRWSPDGRTLAFVSDRSGTAQVYLLDREGGEARQLGKLPLGAGPCRWMPDGRSLLTSAAVAVDPDRRGARAPTQAPRKEEAPEVCWRLPYKSDGVGYLLGREVHLFALDAGSGEARQLTDGAFDVMGFDPSPNGRHIAYSRSREGRFAHCTDLWVCDSDGQRHRRLTHEHATVMQPAWSPDGARIAFAGALKEGDGESRLWQLEFATGRVSPLGPQDMEVADPLWLHWSADAATLVLVRAHRGRHEAVSLDVATGALTPLVQGDRQFSAFGSNGSELFFAVDTPVLPSELLACAGDGGHERQVSDLNPWWHERTPLALEARQFQAPDGLGGTETIEGWLLRAADNHGPMPLLDDAHGGPAAYALLDFDTNVFWQVLCSRGWGILMLNPVGSSSFGTEFCTRLAGHWGNYDLPQHQAALRRLFEDGTGDGRAALCGKSYGGYFTAWAIGHTDLFQAAVIMAPVGNIETHYGTSDGGYYADPLYIGTAPHFDRHKARQLSPLQFIEEAATPALFMQGKDDERCPKCQSEELFVSMMRAGDVPAELVLYPGEDHHFLGEGRPDCRADAARRIVDWVTAHTTKAVASTAAAGEGGKARVHESAAG